jgi:signal transduction histidine kinase
MTTDLDVSIRNSRVHERAIPDAVDHDVIDEVQAAARIGSLPSILDVACRTTGMGFAVLARVTDNRWTACAARDHINTGIDTGDTLDVETTICHNVRLLGRPVVVNDAALDGRYQNHPARLNFGFHSFISVPVILPDGTFFGTLSALDPTPRELDTAESLKSFGLLAELVAFNLDKEFQVAKSQAALVQEKRAAELREQFIAVLGHDLRNPLASIQTSTWILRNQPHFAGDVAELIEQSVDRMAGLIDDVLDFARGRLGSGLPMTLQENADLAATINQVVQELRIARPSRQIVTDFKLTSPVTCDLGRIAQLLSNLVGNAVTHGDPASPVFVRSALLGSLLEISVSNQGTPIPESALSSLFQPFVRASSVSGKQGLGLGLYIASEIAREHAGSLTVRSDEAETRFTFRMPVQQGGD